MFCLVDDKGVIYKPEPKGRGVGTGGKGLYFSMDASKSLSMFL